jgi:hypothetical protein
LVGSIFLTTLIVGVCTIIASKNQKKSAHGKCAWQAVGIGLEAFGFLFFGLTTIYFSKTSIRPVITGSISELRQSGGRYPASDLTVAAASGETAKIHTHYHGEHLKLGDVVAVRYVRYDRTLLDLTILSGDEAGWRLQESDQTLWSGVLAAMGVVFGIGAIRVWRNGPNNSEDHDPSDPTETDGPDPRPMLRIS